MKISELPEGVYRLDFVVDGEVATDEYALLIKDALGNSKLARIEESDEDG